MEPNNTKMADFSESGLNAKDFFRDMTSGYHDDGYNRSRLNMSEEFWLEYTGEDLDFLQVYKSMPDNLTPSQKVFSDILTNLDYYFVPLIIFVGIAGNSLSFVVFVATHLRRQSCNIYLASLAIANNAFLLCVLISWANKLGFGTFHLHGWCQIIMYLTYVGSFLSVWYVVAFTMERYIIVCFPLKRDKLCSTRTAKIVVGSLAVISLVAYSFALFTSGVIDLGGIAVCAPLDAYFRFVATVNNIDTLITLVIPTIFIIGCNIRIMYIVCLFYKTYRDQVGWNQIQKWDFSHNRCSNVDSQGGSVFSSKTRLNCIYSTGNNVLNKAAPVPMSRTAHMRATRMLLIVSTVFLLCNLPRHAARTYLFVMTLVDKDYQPTPTFLLLQELFKIIYYINFAVNVFLYSISGRSFRVGIKRLRFKLKKRWRDIRCHLYYKQASPRYSPQVVSAKTELHINNFHVG